MTGRSTQGDRLNTYLFLHARRYFAHKEVHGKLADACWECPPGTHDVEGFYRHVILWHVRV